jgi:hypothetical protein
MIEIPLINITTTNISIDTEITQGQLKKVDTQPNKIEVSAGNGELNIDAQPAKLNIDTYEARSSLGYGHYNYNDFNAKEAQKGKQAARESTAQVSAEGAQKIRGATAVEIADQKLKSSGIIQSMTVFLPQGGADIEAEKGDLNIDYTQRPVEIQWHDLEVKPLEYQPGDVDFTMTQRPEVNIEYVGDPLYVPPSADPGYDPPPRIPQQMVSEK